MYDIIIMFTALSGINIFFSEELQGIFYAIRQRLKINRNIKAVVSSASTKRYGKVGTHVRMMIEGAEMTKVFPSVEKFFLISAIFGCGVFIMLYSFLHFKVSLAAGTISGCMPYYLVLVRLKIRRTYGSREGDVLIFEILNNYRIQSFNMREAIEYTALNIENAPVSKSVLINLSKHLNLASSEVEINRALDSFKYSFDTAWANILASNIFFAVYRGIRVEKSLEALSSSVSKGRQIVEYEKRENYEAWIMIKYLAPVSYILSIFGGMYFFDLSLRKFIYYQFETETGIKWFFISVLIYFISVGLSKLAASEKMDI